MWKCKYRDKNKHSWKKDQINRDNFTSSFLIWMPFISFSCPIALYRSSSLNISCTSGHPCLVPGLRGIAFSFSPLSIMLTVSVSCIWPFSDWRIYLLFLIYWVIFITTGYWILSNAFFCIYWYYCMIFLYSVNDYELIFKC